MLSIGPIYVQKIKYPHNLIFPVVEKGWTNEIEEPFRRGSCLVFRFPFTKPAIAIGIWQETQDEDTALRSAIWGKELQYSVEELTEWA